MGTRRKWLEWETELLTRNFADSRTCDLAKVLDRTEARVLAKANKLGLKKSRTLIAEMARERTSAPGHGGLATRFKPGTVPPNKGKKMPEGWAPGRMASTQFKPGSKPVTTLPIGSFRVVEGEVLEQKYSDEPGPPGKRWRAYGRLVWEAANGPVPEGHAVVFKPGMKTLAPALVTLDRLELVTRAELMQRNTIHQMPPQLAEIARLRGSLKRAINHKAKEAETT